MAVFEMRNARKAFGLLEVLKGVSLKVEKGEVVSIIGPSGGGKSTLSELIPRFYDPTSGDILIDGVSLRDYTQESLRAHMSVVAQDTVLFNDTIEGNIAMGKPSATHEEIVEAARIANADSFIAECEKGYQTNIGDRGAKLSGGQRQRIGIARALYRRADVLFFDEATSALDSRTEGEINRSIAAIAARNPGLTLLVIAHRETSLEYCDRIITLEK